MLQTDINIDNLKGLETYVKYVDRLLSIKDDKHFQKYFQDKFLETVNKVANAKIRFDTTQDLNDINLYLNSNKIEETSDGFILYNDAKIPADKYNTLPFDTSGYPSGQFSLALAFEYGTGIVAVGAYDTSDEKGFKPWDYNAVGISKAPYHKSQRWYLPKNVYGESHIWIKGYKGFEVYRFTYEEIKNSMRDWLDDYFAKYGGVS